MCKNSDIPALHTTLDTSIGALQLTIVHKPNNKRSYLRIKPNGVLQINTPHTDIPQLEAWVKQQLPWIEQQQRQQSATATNSLPHHASVQHLFEHKTLPYLGEWFTVHFKITAKNTRPKLHCHPQQRHWCLSASAKQFDQPYHHETLWLSVLNQTYLAAAKSYLSDRVHQWSDLTGLQPSRLRFQKMKRRWGSCGHKQQIRLNTQLMQLNTDLIDYVIVHELCHLRHLNHSKDFWQLVSSILPEYNRYHNALKHQQILWF